jgi:predicted lipoprotein with Yx(FWY)xxD motif
MKHKNELRRFTAMKRLLIPAFAVVALAFALALAACGGGGGSSASSGAPASSGGATVSTAQIGDAGMVLVDSNGQALYTNDQETGGNVLCDGACLSFWTPLTVSGMPKGDSLDGKLGVISRPDGGKQVTFDGKLLYTFYQDQPGEVGGDGFTDAFAGQQFTWNVVHADGSTSSSGGGTSTGSGIPGY